MSGRSADQLGRCPLRRGPHPVRVRPLEAGPGGSEGAEQVALIQALPRLDWLILAATAVVILLSRVWAHRHPKIPPE